MKKLALTILLSLITTSGCFATEHLSTALTYHKELKVARQELAEVIAIRDKEANKFRNLEENTKKKIRACFSLTNEEARIKAYAKAEKRSELSPKAGLVKLEEELLNHHQKNGWTNREFLVFNNEKMIGEGHHLLFKVINDKHAHDRGYLSCVSSTRDSSVKHAQTMADMKEDHLTSALAKLSTSDLEKFKSLIATMDSIK